MRPYRQCKWDRALHTSRSLFEEKILQKKSLQRKIFERILRPKGQNTVTKSGFKLWSSHLNGPAKTYERLRELQNCIMDQVNVEGSKKNDKLFDEINQWHFQNTKASIQTPTLLIHGYAASSMSYFRNYSGLSKHFQNLYSIDLPASGLSSIPNLEVNTTTPLPLDIKFIGKDKFKIPYTINASHHKFVIQMYEDYYIDRIEQWRIDNKLDKMNIVGHSFGGYLSFKYAVKYPNSVDKLCLVSPLGVERNIWSVNNNLSSNTLYTTDFKDPGSKFYSKSHLIPKYLFEEQFKLLRLMGPFGAKVCWNYIMAAYSRVPSLAFKEYIFELFYGKGGIPEVTTDIFKGLFSRSILARDPLLDSLNYLNVQKLLVVYGQYDWMNKNGGRLMVKNLNNIGNGSERASYLEVPSSGHNLFLDNPESFNQSIVSFLSEKPLLS
ncbi:alpha/beta hydrolase family protein [Saccharomyces eubayanus]|uniref:alpha/beta hydrolase family protein n=1 Tax=Saccharomyces eubayanus TaxID=1080349 RepID=UPI0006BFB3C1|nr:ECM18-like protein [Saccharomyces eubayanus]KOH00973.1 ECM18-like protein [Saccharomyces eubayanus]